ncbi:MAG: hypothetical protein LBB38_00145 [Puniceicoccales bacterium]|jgi:hypothetical protein|nr:hypothetical protein [Puniceicoccales bacterium]
MSSSKIDATAVIDHLQKKGAQVPSALNPTNVSDIHLIKSGGARQKLTNLNAITTGDAVLFDLNGGDAVSVEIGTLAGDALKTALRHAGMTKDGVERIFAQYDNTNDTDECKHLRGRLYRDGKQISMEDARKNSFAGVVVVLSIYGANGGPKMLMFSLHQDALGKCGQIFLGNSSKIQMMVADIYGGTTINDYMPQKHAGFFILLRFFATALCTSAIGLMVAMITAAVFNVVTLLIAIILLFIGGTCGCSYEYFSGGYTA